MGYLEQVRGISHETRVKALNAIVNAARMGEAGRTLEVLAQEIKTLSDHTGIFSKDVAEVLDSISISVRRLETRVPAESFAVCAKRNDVSAKVSLDAGIEEITKAYAHYNANSLDVFKRAELLKQSISQTSTALEFLPVLDGELSKHLRQLENICRVLSPWAQRNMAETYKLAARYTTRQEHQIHEQHIAGCNGDSIDLDLKNTVSDGNVGNKEDFGDNVDLF